ncbi:MAG: efflux RND transporter periplasmic adaptor subunit [Bacteroidota bacterium]
MSWKSKPLFVLPLFVLMACGDNEAPPVEKIRPVRYAEASFGGINQSHTFSGTASSGSETNLSFKVSGSIATLPVKVGQEVNKKTLIATLDASDYVLELDRSEANVRDAVAQEKQAKSNFERVRQLYENGNESLSEYESAKASYESAQANASSAKKERNLSRLQLSYTKLYAPITGTIATVDAEVNENVTNGQTVVVLNSEGDLEVQLGLPESYISNVAVQDRVKVVFSALEGKEYEGVLSEVSYSISSQTSTYPVVVKLQGETSAIRPGMAATVTFDKGEPDPDKVDKLIVPASAVGEDDGGNFVYLIVPEDSAYVARRQSITVGSLTSAGFEVKDGVAQGDLVATAGLQNLLDGMKVQLFQQ